MSSCSNSCVININDKTSPTPTDWSAAASQALKTVGSACGLAGIAAAGRFFATNDATLSLTSLVCGSAALLCHGAAKVVDYMGKQNSTPEIQEDKPAPTPISKPTPLPIPAPKKTRPLQEVRPKGSTDTSAPVNGVWYLTWRAQVGVPPAIPTDVNLVNIFVGQLDPNTGVSGLQGAFANPAVLQQFVQSCHAQGIQVTVSIGGNGGSYDNTWNQLTSGNIQQYAQNLVTFCQTNGLDGIDFDWEPDTYTQPQGLLVGQLIAAFKAQAATQGLTLFASLCTNSASCWEAQAGWVFGTANGGIDRLNIMAYYPATQMEPYISGPGGWESWIATNSPNTKIIVGMLSNAPDLQAFSAWDATQQQNGVGGTGLWYFDPADVPDSDAATAIPWDAFHASALNKKQQQARACLLKRLALEELKLNGQALRTERA